MAKIKSLKKRLTTLMMMLTIIPLVLSNLLQLNSFKKFSISHIKEQQKELVDIKSQNIDEWLEEKINTLNLIYENNPIFASNDKNKIIKRLNEIKNFYTDVKAFGYVDKEGNLKDTNEAEINISEQEHFNEAKKSNNIVLSDIFVDKIDNKKIVALDRPILDKQGNFNGIIQITVDVSFIENLINKIKIEDNGYSYLVSKNGQFLINKDNQLIGKNLKEVDKNAYDILNKSINDKGENFLAYKSSKNKERYLTAYKELKNVRWILVTLAPSKEVFRELIDATVEAVVIIVVTVVIITIIGALLFKKLIKVLDNTENLISDTSNFNLVNNKMFDKYLERKDEIGNIFQQLGNMRKSLKVIVEHIKDDATNINLNTNNLSRVMNETSIALDDISKASDNIAYSSTDLAKSVTDGVDKLNNLASEIHDANELSFKVKEYMEETEDKNKKGIEYIQSLEKSVNSSDKSVKKLFDEVQNLQKKSENINVITDTIKGVTEQINLLSLNAAIEAARAGENGKGFAVVAEEIRKLAYETNTSTEKIEKVVKEMEQAVLLIRKEIDISGKNMEEMNSASIDTKNIFELISDNVNDTTEQINQLMSKISNIDSNKNEVLNYMENISAISEESASTTEEVSASVQQQTSNMDEVVRNTKDLENITINLQSLISKFKL
ncbi:methyl-accepting chemotaxis protein [Hathewaya limosa]|uniref:Methyl-accepting chemotaxis protein n=1 Tax=Hathewaya limosa TaxID=1536 RepID=A0ABU0JPZ6_HATLI|nr:methyl-accepting chemotaxis protein [Hathewaya limosa]MDQ0479145.1 methyl-accepting chemotaxis protein [Hathewaya limosa]